MSCGKPCDCPSYREHLLSVSIGAAAMPTRRPEAIRVGKWEASKRRDIDAYKRLRKDGLQPQRIDGSRELEQKAEHSIEVETGQLLDA